MDSLLQSLKGDDLRSIGVTNQVVSQVLDTPELFTVLVQGLTKSDPILRMRCADAMEKITRHQPELLHAYKQQLIQQAATIEQQEVRWHLAPMLARLPLEPTEVTEVIALLLSFMEDKSSIVKTMTMQALTEIALHHSDHLQQITKIIEAFSISGTPAMKARGKKLLSQL